MITKPIGKIVTVGALGGSIGTILVWAFNTYATIYIPAFVIPAEPAMAIQTVIISLLQWWIKSPHIPTEDDTDE